MTPFYTTGSNTPNQEKNKKAVKTNWNKENAYSRNMETDITTPYENLTDQGTIEGAPYYVAKKIIGDKLYSS